MSVDAAVRQASEALRRAHSLFGHPESGDTGPGLAEAVALSGAGQPATTSSGLLADQHDAFAAAVTARLETWAHSDDRLGSGLRDAADADRTGRRLSGRIVDAADADAARRSWLSDTPAGQRALITALRHRVAVQLRLVSAFEAHDARMAVLLRELTYLRGAQGGFGRAIPWQGGAATSGLPPWSPRAVRRDASRDRIHILHTAAVRDVDTGSGGTLTNDSGPRDCAGALVSEAHRRGYSPAQTRAILSTMLQESGGLPRAVSPNGEWRSLFQQDESYPGRDDPNTAISGFLNRLAAKGGPSSPDIWKAIFWVQQAPGASSAEAAYAGGRRAYLREIQSQIGRATAMYDELMVR